MTTPPPANPAPGAAAPRLRKAAALTGRQLVLRDVARDDAAFIWRLRHDPARNRYMSATSAQLADQLAWLDRYAADDTQAYFLITARDSGAPLGTVRLYDARGERFGWGSWMLVPGAPAAAAMESALMVYHYARWLGFSAAHFEVHMDNAPVRRFHERFGARVVGQRGDQVQYLLDADQLTKSLIKYSRWLPDGMVLRTGDGQTLRLPAVRGAEPTRDNRA